MNTIIRTFWLGIRGIEDHRLPHSTIQMILIVSAGIVLGAGTSITGAVLGGLVCLGVFLPEYLFICYHQGKEHIEEHRHES